MLLTYKTPSIIFFLLLFHVFLALMSRVVSWRINRCAAGNMFITVLTHDWWIHGIRQRIIVRHVYGLLLLIEFSLQYHLFSVNTLMTRSLPDIWRHFRGSAVMNILRMNKLSIPRLIFKGIYTELLFLFGVYEKTWI